MTTLTRWNPFRQLSRLDPMADIDELFRLGGRALLRDAETPPELRMDVAETDGRYEVKIDVPGVRKEDIEVSIDGRQVSIRAEIRREAEKKEGKDIHTERYVGSTFRAFTLPQEIDDAKAEARYADGVVQLTLPKKSNSRSQRIAIQ